MDHIMPEYLLGNLDIPIACLTEVGVEASGVGEVVRMAVTQVPLAHQVGGVPRLLQVLPRPIFTRLGYRYKAELKVFVFGIFRNTCCNGFLKVDEDWEIFMNMRKCCF